MMRYSNAARSFSSTLKALVVGLTISCMCISTRAQHIKLPPVTRTSLRNGVKLVLMEYHKAPTLSLSCQFPGGTATDPTGKSGLAGITAELLRKGTTKRTAQQIAEEIDFLGGSLGTGVGPDRFGVSLNVLSKDTAAGLEVLTDVLRNPTFPAEELERERALELASLQALPEDPGAVARRVGTELTFTGDPYGEQPTVTSVKAISREDVLGQYHRIVAPERMTIIAVGDFTTQQMIAQLKTRFEDWPASATSAPTAGPVKPGARMILLIDKPDATQTQVRYVRQAFKRSSPDHFAAELASAALGGGFTSRLTDEIRINRSLTYSIGSGFGEQLRGGSFVVSTFTKIDTTRALLDAVRTVLQKTAEQGLTASELKKVKGYLAGSFAIQMQTPEAIAGELADMAFFGLPNDYLETYIDRLNAVTLAQVNRIAKSYFSPASLSVVMVAPAKSVSKQLAGIGTYETRSIETVVK